MRPYVYVLTTILFLITLHSFTIWLTDTNTKGSNESLREIGLEALTGGVEVLPINACHDQRRQFPLREALQAGAKSIEVNVWFDEEDSQLYVASNMKYTTKGRTLKSVYLDDLWQILEASNNLYVLQNVTVPFDHHHKYGVYYNFPESSMYLMINIRSGGIKALEILEHELTKFVEAEYLAYIDNITGTFHQGPITVITTNDVSLKYYDTRSVEKQFTFPEAPIQWFIDGSEVSTHQINSYAKYCLVASGSFSRIIQSMDHRFGLSDTELLKELTSQIHRNNLQVRLSGIDEIPISARLEMMNSLFDIGVDLIDIENLEDITYFTQEREKRWQ